MKKIIAPLLLSTLACAAQAATITVNNATDGSVSTACTLRDAIASVNNGVNYSGGCAASAAGSLGAGDTIEFALPPGVDTIAVEISHIEIGKNLIINAPAGGITLDANPGVSGSGGNRIFHVTGGSSLSITGVRFVDGNAGGGFGGAIEVATGNHTLTLEHCAFENNQASFGGAVWATTATISNSTFEGNWAADFGGAVNATTATISNSTFEGNSADSYGGAVYANSTATISNSTFEGNSANYHGGAVYAGTATISNSTFEGNSANYHGGAVYASTATISNSTFEGNSANYYGGAVYAGSLNARHLTLLNNTATSGSGQALNVHDSTATLHNSIIIGSNGDAQCVKNNGSFTGSYNLEGWVDASGDWQPTMAATTCGSGPSVTVPNGTSLSTIIATTLADNGGPTKTLALTAGSPAISAADLTGTNTESLDQRGSARKTIAASRRDVGAYERNDLTITGNMPNGMVNVSYAGGSVIASGGTGAITYAVTRGVLPPELSLQPDGTVTGTPTQAGTWSFAITASDASGNLTGMGFEVTIHPRAASSGTPIPALPAPLLVLTGLLAALAGLRLRKKAGSPQG